MSRSFLTSDRLLYEPFDVTTDEGKALWYKLMEGDMEVRPKVSSFMVAPTARAASDENLKNLKSAVFFAAVCLKPENWAEVSAEPNDGSMRGTPIGLLSLQASRGNRAHLRSSHIGAVILASHQGKGYGTEAVKFLVDWAFLFGNLHSVRLETGSNNMASVRCYEKAGFVHEGRLRQDNYWNGEWYDTILMSVLRDEWQARRDATKQQEDVQA